MEKTSKHKLLNSAFFTAFAVPLGFFLLRDTIIVLADPVFKFISGEGSLLYEINADIARFITAGLLMLIIPLFFREKCNFGFKGGKLRLGILLALPELVVPAWNLLQIKVYDAPLVSGAVGVVAAIIHGISPAVSEEVFCRGFAVSNLMRIREGKPNRILYCMLLSGLSFGLLHALNAIATGDIAATLIQIIYTAAIGMMNGAVYLRSRSIWGVILMHTLTDVSAFIAVFDGSVTAMDIAFCAFGSLLFVGLALYLVRPSKHAEIEALWADGWSFGDETKKNHAIAKTVAIISAALAAVFAAALCVTIYQAKTGVDPSPFPAANKALDKDIQYEIGADGKELVLTLPDAGGDAYELNNSAPESFVLKESGKSENACRFVFSHESGGAGTVRLTFSLKPAESPISFKDYSVTVVFDEQGCISAVRG